MVGWASVPAQLCAVSFGMTRVETLAFVGRRCTELIGSFPSCPVVTVVVWAVVSAQLYSVYFGMNSVLRGTRASSAVVVVLVANVRESASPRCCAPNDGFLSLGSPRG